MHSKLKLIDAGFIVILLWVTDGAYLAVPYSAYLSVLFIRQHDFLFDSHPK